MATIKTGVVTELYSTLKRGVIRHYRTGRRVMFALEDVKGAVDIGDSVTFILVRHTRVYTAIHIQKDERPIAPVFDIDSYRGKRARGGSV